MRELSDDATTNSGPAQATPEPPPPMTDRISDGLQNLIKALIGSNRRPPRRFKTLLSGTWLGHPLHPAITDVPIGAWMIAAIFDIIWLVAPASAEWAARGAEVAVLIGILGALGAAVTGMSDWSDTYGAERTVGLYHAALNVLAVIFYIVSFVLRLTIPTGESIVAAILGFLGVVSVLIAAYLGGDMVFGKATGVNHTVWPEGTHEYVPVLPVAEMPESALKRVEVAGVPVVLLKLGAKYFAIAATCSHAGGPLDEGELQGEVVQCPWHGSRFRLADGKAITGPATASQPRYDVQVRDGMILLKQA